jgi:hypothetical protein
LWIFVATVTNHLNHVQDANVLVRQFDAQTDMLCYINWTFVAERERAKNLGGTIALGRQ